MQVSINGVMQDLNVLEQNSEFDEWDSRDKIVLSWIYISISHNYLKYLIGKDRDYAHAYWRALEKVFFDNS